MMKLSHLLLVLHSYMRVVQSTNPRYAPIGRSKQGKWNGLDYEIFYYVQVIYAQGPSKKIDCVLSGVEDAFVNITNDTPKVTLEQMELINRAHAHAHARAHATHLANSQQEEQEEDSQSQSQSQAPVVSSTAQARSKSFRVATKKQVEKTGIMIRQSTRQERPSMLDEEREQVQEEYEGQWQEDEEELEEEEQNAAIFPASQDIIRESFGNYLASMGGGRNGVAYRLESIAALYLDGKYIHKFQDATDALMGTNTTTTSVKEFLIAELSKLVTTPPPPSRPPYGPYGEIEIDPAELEREREIYDHYDILPLNFMYLSDNSRECIRSLDGDYYYGDDDPSINNTSIIGRTLAGQWEGVSYEILSFFEIFALVGLKSQQQETCFYDLVDSVFVNPFADEVAATVGVETENGTTTTTTATTAITVTDLTLEQQHRARGVAQQEEFFRASLNYTQIRAGDGDSIFADIAESASGSFSSVDRGMSFQRGAAVFVQGNYLRSYDDAPPGMKAILEQGLESTMLRNFTSLFPAGTHLLQLMEDRFSMMEERGLSIYMFLLPELLQQCVTEGEEEEYNDQEDEHATSSAENGTNSSRPPLVLVDRGSAEPPPVDTRDGDQESLAADDTTTTTYEINKSSRTDEDDESVISSGSSAAALSLGVLVFVLLECMAY